MEKSVSERHGSEGERRGRTRLENYVEHRLKNYVEPPLGELRFRSRCANPWSSSSDHRTGISESQTGILHADTFQHLVRVNIQHLVRVNTPRREHMFYFLLLGSLMQPCR